MAFDLTAIMGEFQAEANEHIETLNARLLELERNPDAPEAIRSMFLSAHTIKGSAAMLDLQQINVLAHAVEDVLAYLRDNQRALNAETADLLFKSLDKLRAMIARPVLGDAAPEPAILELSAALRRNAMGAPAAEDEAVPRPAKTAAVPRAVETTAVPEAPLDPAVLPRALLVDASATVRLLETMQLREAGYEVDAVADGMVALEQAMARSYDLLVTGVECDSLRGWDLAAALRDVLSSRSMPIIMMSSDRDADQRELAGAGLYAYLRKGSLHRHDLEETARRLLAEREDAAGRKGIA